MGRAIPIADQVATLVERWEDAVFVADLDCKILAWNLGAEKLYGYKPEEILGKKAEVLLPGDRSDEKAKMLSRIGAGKTLEHFETCRIKKNGDQIQVSVSAAPLVDESGQVVGIVTIARDISELKKSTADLEEMNKLMVGREMKMMELKQRIRELEGGKGSDKENLISLTWKQKFQRALEFEEEVIAKLGDFYLSSFSQSELSQEDKQQANALIHTLITDSLRHESEFKQLEAKVDEEKG